MIINPQRITKPGEKIANDRDYKDIKFPLSKKHYSKIKKKIFALMYFVMKMT